MTTTVDVSEAQEQLQRLLEIAKSGNEVIIAEGEIPIARLTGVSAQPSAPSKRILGLHQGAATISDDFDAPLPDDFWLVEE